MENWKTIDEYPNYSVSDQGRVRNDRTDRILAISQIPSGHCYVGVVGPTGTQAKRMVSKFVASAFVYRPQYNFNTPIHLDGDLGNCVASNLQWRPRWFAMKYTRQFRERQWNHAPVRDKKTGEVYEDLWPLVIQKGLLHRDILLAAANSTYVFPTMEFYEWAE